MMFVSFLFLAFLIGGSLASHCVDGKVESASFVKTLNGDILGFKQTQIDPRQNKTVTWTSFYVRSKHFEHIVTMLI